MKTFFFDVSDGFDLTVDDEGITLANCDEIPRNALEGLVDLARDVIADPERRRLTITVRSDANTVVYRAELTITEEWAAETRAAADTVEAEG